MGILQPPADKSAGRGATAGAAAAPMAGARCPECGNFTVIHKDGCEFCTACGYIGACG
jgi:ribonucleoside-diphosphate reductase alpha chain